MRILVSGASGLIGTAVQKELQQQGHDFHLLVREEPAAPNEHFWDPATGQLSTADWPAFDGAIHLSGYNIAKKRWTPEVKDLILHSRVDSTDLLSTTLSELPEPPRVFVAASAIGYYGDRGDELLTEESAPGQGEFLPEVCMQWERATAAAAAAGIRVVNARIGPVLTPDGGVLQDLLLPFKLGLGGRIGNGRQWFSWISRVDVARSLVFAMQAASLRGGVNLVAPNPVRNREFTKALGKALHRPTLLPVPAFLIKMLLGQMAEELPLASTRVDCSKLLEAGFDFQHREIGPALDQLLEA